MQRFEYTIKEILKDKNSEIGFAQLFLLCCSYMKRTREFDVDLFFPIEYLEWLKLDVFDKDIWKEFFQYFEENIPSHISNELSSMIYQDTKRFSSIRVGSLYGRHDKEFNYDNLENLSMEQLKEIVLRQNEALLAQKRLINKLRDKATCSNKTDNSPIKLSEISQLQVRERLGEKVEPFQSNIDLREDDWIKDEDKGNGEDASIDPTRFRHTMIDIIRVVYTLWKLGYFVEFNPEIQGKKDFNIQKKAKLKDVMETVGNALNMPYLYKIYDNEFAKSFSENEKLYRFVDDDDILRIFDRMRNVMKNEIKTRKEKRNRKKGQPDPV